MYIVFLYLLDALARITQQCSIVETGYVLNKFYTPWCPSCQKLEPIIKDIDNKIERNEENLVINEINCDECACEGIKMYPTLKLTKDGKVLDVMEGFNTYDNIIKFIEKNTKISDEVLEESSKVSTAKEGKVMQLKADDFLGGFDGPHVVLFYAKADDKFRDLLKELAVTYEGKIKFGEIDSNESYDLLNRYNIRAYPTVTGIYNGITAQYTGSYSIDSLTKFCDELIRPSFQNLTLEDFNTKVSELEHGEPIYVVFHNDLSLASAYYIHPAHTYKFKTKIYRSNDVRLFEKASIFPKKIGDGENNTSPNHEDVVILTVYKNGAFYKYDGKLGDESQTADWLFHTHYKYVTKVNNDNFYTIFHGLKPVLLLLTTDEQYIKGLNKFSADRHLGAPYADMVFAALDLNLYPLFVPTLLPKLKTPSLVVFEPWKNLFYHEHEELSENNFEKSAMETYSKYQKATLPLYPKPASSKLKYMLAGGAIFGLGVYLYQRIGVTKKGL